MKCWILFTQRDYGPVEATHAVYARDAASARNKAARRGVKDIVDARCVDDSIANLVGALVSKRPNVPRKEM